MISRRVVAVPAFALLLAASCSASSDTSDINGPGNPVPDGGATDASSATDAPGSATDGAPSACSGACKTTALTADFGGKKRVLVRAQFGTKQGGVTLYHTESHLGGSAACPTQSSPTPDYTLVVSAIPRGSKGKKLSDRDGITGGFFDFKGDLGLPPLTKAVTVYLTVVDEDPATPPKWVAIDVTAGFREGEVKGHLYAEACPSLNE